LWHRLNILDAQYERSFGFMITNEVGGIRGERMKICLSFVVSRWDKWWYL